MALVVAVVGWLMMSMAAVVVVIAPAQVVAMTDVNAPYAFPLPFRESVQKIRHREERILIDAQNLRESIHYPRPVRDRIV